METCFPNCNFAVQLQQVYYSLDGLNEGKPARVLASIQTDKGQTHDWLVAPEELTVNRLTKKFVDLLIPPKAAIKDKVTFLLRKQLADLLAQRPFKLLQFEGSSSAADALHQCLVDDEVTPPGIYFTKTGWHRLPSGAMVFVAGNQVIGDISDDYAIDPSISSICLSKQVDCQSEAVLRFLDMLMLEPQSYPAVWSFSLATSLLPMFTQADIEFQAVLYCIGKYGTGKSTVVKRLYALYDTIDCQPRHPALIYDAGSSFAALREKLSAFGDVPVVLDDLCSSVDRENIKKRKQLTAQVLRFAANKTPQVKGVHGNSEELCAVSGLAVTAELSLDTQSEWSRFFPVRFYEGQAHIPPEVRGLAAAILHAFLAWVAPQYDALQEDLQAEYRNKSPIIHKEAPRINTTLFVTSWVSYIFARFCGEYCGLSEREEKKYLDQFNNAANSAISFLMNQIHALQEKKPQETIAQLIVRGIDSGALPLCKKAKELYKNAGIKRDGKIYLWPNAVHGWVTSQIGYENCRKIQISRYLNTAKILILEYADAAEYTVHFETNGHRPRLLCLDEKALHDVASQETANR